MRTRDQLLAVAILIGINVLTSVGAVPNLISYQGVLNDSVGAPVSSSVQMTFSLYEQSTGGAPLWSETQNVPVSNGLFNVKLGSVQQLNSSVFGEEFLYLGVQVGSDAEMVPRQRVTSGAYAYKAESLSPSGVRVGTVVTWMKSLNTIFSGSVTGSAGYTLMDAGATFDSSAVGAACYISPLTWDPSADCTKSFIFSDDSQKGLLISGGTDKLYHTDQPSARGGYGEWIFYYTDGTDESFINNIPSDSTIRPYTYTNPNQDKLVWKVETTAGSDYGTVTCQHHQVSIHPAAMLGTTVTAVESPTQILLADDLALSTSTTYTISLTPPLPDEWVELHGQTIHDPDSVYNDTAVPDLNGEYPSSIPGAVWIMKIK